MAFPADMPCYVVPCCNWLICCCCRGYWVASSQAWLCTSARLQAGIHGMHAGLGGMSRGHWVAAAAQPEVETSCPDQLISFLGNPKTASWDSSHTPEMRCLCFVR